MLSWSDNLRLCPLFHFCSNVLKLWNTCSGDSCKNQIIFCKYRGYKVYDLHASCWDNFMVSFLLTTVLSIHHLHYWFIYTDSGTHFSRQTHAFLMCIASAATFWPTLTGSVYKVSSMIIAHSCILALGTNQAQQASLCLPALSSLFGTPVPCLCPRQAGLFYFLHSITEYQVNIISFNTYPILMFFTSDVVFPIPKQRQALQHPRLHSR